MSDKDNDIYLWESMKSGDEQALSRLFLLHYQPLYDYGFKLCLRDELVKDCIQDVFAYIWEKRANLSAVESVRAYLLAALRRALLRKLQKIRRQQQVREEFLESPPATTFSPEDLLLMREGHAFRAALVDRILKEVPVRMREALYLKTFDKLSYSEISAIMDISPQVARNYVYEAIQRLRRLTGQILEKY